MSLEERTIDFDCPEHGAVTVRQIKLGGSGWGNPSCEKCAEDREVARSEKLKAEQARDAENARKFRVERFLTQSKIPPRFADRDFASYVPPDDKAARILAACSAYAAGFPEMKAAGRGLILCGNAGTGKTHIACAVASSVIKGHACSAVYATAGGLFRAVKDTYRRDSGRSEEDALGDYSRPDLLVLDEIGVQYGSAAELNILFDVVNERYGRMLPTILISNLALPKLTEYAGERVIDRMKENGGKVLVFDGKSKRGAA